MLNIQSVSRPITLRKGDKKPISKRRSKKEAAAAAWNSMEKVGHDPNNFFENFNK